MTKKELQARVDELEELLSVNNKENQALVTEVATLKGQIKIIMWARDKFKEQAKELENKNKKLRTAITYMLHQLTNKYNPPSIKIALAIEESIPVYELLKEG